MDEESLQKADVRARTFDEPTLEDKFNKESLPSILQVKKFGLRGRTKYTHLVDQDTTDFLNPLAQRDMIKNTFFNKGAGVGDVDGPSVKKKRNA
jgi:microfibrillar-associated protein 1